MKWTKEEDQILREMYGKVTYKEICKCLPSRTRYALMVRKRILGLQVDTKHLQQGPGRRYDLNESFFEKPNVYNCYVAGLLAADGCVKRGNGKRGDSLSLFLHKNDMHIIETIKQLLSFTGEIKTTSDKTQKGLYICSKKIIHDLEVNFNIVPSKTFILQPPNITDEILIKAFIKGYIDGDGGIGLYGKPLWTIHVCSASKIILDWIKCYFDLWYPISRNGLSNVRPHESIHRYCVAGKRAIEIMKILCEIKTPYLTRKWTKFMKEHDCFYEFISPKEKEVHHV